MRRDRGGDYAWLCEGKELQFENEARDDKHSCVDDMQDIKVDVFR